MMKLNVSFLALWTFLMFVPLATLQAEEINVYVSVAGNDANSGTKEQPLASLSGALDKVRSLKKSMSANVPVTVWLGDGTYYVTEPLVFHPDNLGSGDASLVFKAEEGAHPVICGGKQISGFEAVSQSLWRAKVLEVALWNWHFEQLYVNGQRAPRAKSPNKGFYFLKNVQETVLSQGKSKRSPDLAMQKMTLYDDGVRRFADVAADEFDQTVVTFYHKWDNTRKRVSAFDPDSSAIFIVGEGMKPWNRMDAKTRYTVENYRAALDTCGEWFLDRSGYLYYMPKPGETIANTEVVAPVTGKFLVFQGDEKTGKKVKNISFEGLSFQVAGYQMPQNGENPAQAATPVEAVVMADFAENIRFTACEISLTATNAVWFRKACSNCLVEHCYFHDLGAGGIKIGDPVQPEVPENLTKNIVVDNNIIRSGGFVFPCAVGVTIFNASDNQVTHNEIADFRYSGVSVGWVWGYTYSPSKRNKIEFNHIHHLGWGELCDMGGVYCLGRSEGTTVSNNVVHHVYSFDYGGWGLYTDEGSTGIVMENNLVYSCKNSAFHQHYGKENIIRNNLFVNNMKAQLQATRIEDHLSFTFTNNIVVFNTGDLITSNWGKINLQTDRNCYWDFRTKDVHFGSLSFADWQKSGKDQHSVIANPDLVNPDALDFHIRNKTVMRKIGFNEFDYTQAGVYGSDEWRKLAGFDQQTARLFDLAVKKNEARK